GDPDSVRAVVQVLEQNGEFVATEAGQRVLRPQAGFDSAGELHQQFVTNQVAEAVVDHLEAVQVQHHHCVAAPFPGAAGDGVGQSVVEQYAVRQAGQGVVKCVVLQLALDLLALGDVAGDADVAGETAFLVQHRGEAEYGRKGAAVAAHELDFAFPGVVALQRLANFLQPGPIRFRHDQLGKEPSPGQLSRPEAELGGAAVPVDDATLDVGG